MSISTGVLILETNLGYGSDTTMAGIGNDIHSLDIPFVGVIDEVRISSDVLNPKQFLNAVVPEPSTMGLLLTGWALVAWWRKRS